VTDEADRPGSPAPRPSLLRNRLSIIGLVPAVWGLTGFALFFLLDLAPGETRAYSAVNLIPSLAVVALGVLLIALGVLREARRRRSGRGPSLERTLRVELGAAFFASLGAATALVTLLMTTVGTTAANLYEITESNTFCGETCHSVMEPEWVAFQEGAHSRLDCVECHIGPKAPSRIAYKLNGLRQVALVATGGYERPIPTPVKSLRPAREICEHCHWSGRFIDYRESTRTHFLADEETTPFKVRMLTKVGGSTNGIGEGAGIHYHMVSTRKVEYVARDPQRQKIPWVRVTLEDGRVTEYVDSDDPLDEAERAQLELRTMDCLDCHNRPAHRFESPARAVDAAIAAGAISRKLPFVKARSVTALDGSYATGEEALAGIAVSLTEFYEDEHPDVLEEHRGDLEKSIEAVRKIYRRNFFPEMKASWRAHPDNAGHLESPGCFRCHNDRMESEEGEQIKTDCNTCHLILAQGENVRSISTDGTNGNRFFHPDDDDYLDEYTDCTDCHTGGADLYE